MGYLTSVITAEEVKHGRMSLEDGLAAHLRSNICPPRSPKWVPVLIEALAYLNEPNRRINITETVDQLGEEVPDSDYDDCGQVTASVSQLVHAFYLEGFVRAL